MIAIMGATGNTGKVVAEKLLAAGRQVRVIGRDASRLEPLVKSGAQAVVGDVTNAAALARAFTGAKAVYVMIPPNLAVADVRAFQEQVSNAAAAAIEEARVEYAVLLSSIGADKAERTGPVIGLHHFEQKLNSIPGLKALYVRAGYFMENLLAQVGVIKGFGILGGPVSPALPLPMIATRDIGAYAADALQKLNFSGKQAREILGQRNVTYNEVAAIVGNAIGRPGLAYAQLPPEQLKPALTQMGMSANMADLLLEMAEALNTGYMTALEARTAANTTPTSIEQFVAEVFVPLYNAKGAGA
jgi:uncharacterized protein YbjT (DUF2867 family)